MWLRRIGILVGAVLLLWFALLVVLGLAYGSSRGEGIAERLGEAVKGEGSVEGSDLALVRGRLAVEQLRVRRDDEVGKLAIDIGELRCELPPLGIALFDGECRELVLDGLSLDVSTFDVFRVQRPKRPPMRAREVVIENATIGVPLDNGRVDVKLAYIIAGPTVFKTPVSWLFELRGLRATVTMPLGTIELAYLNGVLVAWGGIFTAPLVISVPMPALDPADDNRAELARIVAWGKVLAKRVLKENVKALMRQPL